MSNGFPVQKGGLGFRKPPDATTLPPPSQKTLAVAIPANLAPIGGAIGGLTAGELAVALAGFTGGAALAALLYWLWQHYKDTPEGETMALGPYDPTFWQTLCRIGEGTAMVGPAHWCGTEVILQDAGNGPRRDATGYWSFSEHVYLAGDFPTYWASRSVAVVQSIDPAIGDDPPAVLRQAITIPGKKQNAIPGWMNPSAVKPLARPDERAPPYWAVPHRLAGSFIYAEGLQIERFKERYAAPWVIYWDGTGFRPVAKAGPKVKTGFIESVGTGPKIIYEHPLARVDARPVARVDRIAIPPARPMEHKIRISKRGKGLTLVNRFTEWLDGLDAVYKAIPGAVVACARGSASVGPTRKLSGRIRLSGERPTVVRKSNSSWYRGKDGRWHQQRRKVARPKATKVGDVCPEGWEPVFQKRSPAKKLKYVLQNWQQIDLRQAMLNLAENELKDRAIGKLAHGVGKNQYKRTGYRGKSLLMGPAL